MAKKKVEWRVPYNYKDIIHEGMSIKNYKELCVLMGWKPTTGTSKIAQLKEFDRFFEYDKMKNAYKITKIIESPKEIVDMRTQNGNIYADSMESIIINMLSSIEAKELTLTKSGWLTLIGALNKSFDEYSIHKYRISDLAGQTEVSPIEIKDMMEKLEKNLWSSFDRVLIKLQKQYLITFEDVLVYYKKNGVDDSGNDIIKDGTTTPQEYEIYREIVRDELDRYGCKTESDLYRAYDPETEKNLNVEMFYRRLSSMINAEFGWVGHYKARTIRYTQRQVKKYLDTYGLEDEKFKLNNNVVVQAIKSAAKRHDMSKGELIIDNLDEEGLELLEELQPEQYTDMIMDEEEGFKKLGMKYYYGQPEYPDRAKRIITELVELKREI